MWLEKSNLYFGSMEAIDVLTNDSFADLIIPLEKYNTVWEWPDRQRVVPMTFKVIEDIHNMLSLLYPPVVKILLSCD